MKDPNHMLIQQTENIQSARQMRFTSIALIDEFESIIKMYIQEAIEIEKSGQKVEKKAARKKWFTVVSNVVSHPFTGTGTLLH